MTLTTEQHVRTSPKWARALSSALDTPWVVAIVRKSAIDETLADLHPMLSLNRVRARIVRIIDETPTTKTFELKPNAMWGGATAGQYIRIQIEINGRLMERVYSLSSGPGAGSLAITVKRQDGGLVSDYLHRSVKVGQVITISQASGEFVLPKDLPAKILLLSGGSGITAVMGLLQELVSRDYKGDVVFMHTCRDRQDLIFADRLNNLANELPALRVVVRHTAAEGRLDESWLRASVPDFSERATWMCGPATMMDWVSDVWRDRDCRAPLHSERFAAPRMFSPAPQGTPVDVSLTSSGGSFKTHGADPLLVQAERAGLTPKHGCRIGICRSCQCIKKSGTVENLLTGEISSAPDELIRLCISTARSDIALDL